MMGTGGIWGMRAFVVVVLLATIGLASCAPPPIVPQRFSHATSTQQTFLEDRFACIKQAQQRQEGGYVGAYGGSYGSAVVVSKGVFDACMAAKGYSHNNNGPLAASAEIAVMMVP